MMSGKRSKGVRWITTSAPAGSSTIWRCRSFEIPARAGDPFDWQRIRARRCGRRPVGKEKALPGSVAQLADRDVFNAIPSPRGPYKGAAQSGDHDDDQQRGEATAQSLNLRQPNASASSA